jgi:hypothetical protein
MPYGYLGQNTPNQTVSNSGVFSISDVASLEKQGKFGGSLELIAEQTVASVSSIDFTSIQETKYDVHFLQFFDMLPASGGDTTLRFSTDGGSTFVSTGYQYAYQQADVIGNFNEFKSTNSTAINWVAGNGGPEANEIHNAYVYLYNLGNSSKYSFTSSHSMSNDTSNTGLFTFGGGVYPTANTVNAIQIRHTSGATFSCTAKLYGVKQL